MAEGLSATAGALAAWSQAFLSDAFKLSTVSVSAQNSTSPGMTQYAGKECGQGERCGQTREATAQTEGRARPGATVRARMPSVARSALSGMTGKMAASFQLWSTDDQS